MASAVTSYSSSFRAELMPSTSPERAIRRINVRPSREVAEIFTRPEQMTKTALHASPSRNKILPRRYSIGIEFTSRKESDLSPRLQKGCLQACGQLRQLATVVSSSLGLRHE